LGNTATNSIPIPVSAASERSLIYLALYTLIAIYAVSRVLQGFPQSAPMLVIVTLHVLPPLLFALLHGRLLWGWRGILVFFGICSVVSGTVEKIGRSVIISLPMRWGRRFPACRFFSGSLTWGWATYRGSSQA
jgi:hypothetical protein